MLNQEQQLAVDHINGPVLIIAGAGSGKTTTLINRTANIISSGIDPNNVLLLTFTNKAANEMKTRGAVMLDDRFNGVTACTYHSFCNLLLRKYMNYLGRMGEFVIIDQTTATETIKLVMSKIEGTDIRGFPHADTVNSIISSSINKQMTVADTLDSAFEKYSMFLRKIEEIKDKYIEYKREKNQLDYDDLMLKCIEMLEKHNNIRRMVASKYQYIMVDEYQDSNLIQLKLLKLLCYGKQNPNICVVGDDQQSIYLFRGAQFENIINYPKEFPGCETIILNKNYRSNQEILDLSNRIIKDAPEKYDKNLEGFKTKGEKPYLVYTSDSMEATSYIIGKIKSYKSDGLKYSDIAVLSRGSRATELLEGRLKINNIPFEKYGGVKFNDRAFVQDIIALLKISVNLCDEVAWFRWFHMYPGIGAKTAHVLYDAIYRDNNMCAIKNNKKFSKYFSELITVYEKFSKQSFDKMYHSVCDYYFTLRALQIKAMENDARTTTQGIESAEALLKNDKQDCEEILDVLAAKYTKANDFISDIALNNNGSESEDDNVVISTVHSIKGLEFKVVFLFDCVEGSFPFTMSEGDHDSELAEEYAQKEMKEERRILYVAVTRAKDDLYIMFPQMVQRFGSYEAAELNRYLVEPLKEGYLESIKTY